MTPAHEQVRIERWDPYRSQVEDDLAMLADILHACVNAGAAVNFVLPFSIDDAIGFWRAKVLPYVQAGTCRVLTAATNGRIVGTVQLDLATPPNQSHRVEARKLLVHPEWRRGGIARRLMLALEQQTRDAGRSLITLDTRTGDFAEVLYRSMGYITAGTIPRYSMRPDGSELETATFMYKELISRTVRPDP
jgi:GNAT superfamily N-acetyltransferase